MPWNRRWCRGCGSTRDRSTAARRPGPAAARRPAVERSASRSRVSVPKATPLPSSARMTASSSTSLMSTSLRGTGEPHREQRHEALTAGEHLCLVAVLGEQRQDLVDRCGARGTRTVRFFTPAPPRRYELEDPRHGRERCLFAYVYAQRQQRVLDRVRETRGRNDHPAFADAAEVDVRVGQDRVDVMDLEVRDDGRRRHQVVHERRREELAVLVVRCVLEEHRADRLRDATSDLALDDRWVHRQAAVLDDHVAVDR